MLGRRWTVAMLGACLLATTVPGLVLAQEEGPYPVEDIEWQLDQYVSDGVYLDVPAGVEVTLLLSDGTAGGDAGCNTYFGSYVIDATSLTFPEALATTLRLCEGAAQEVENAYLPLLAAVAGWAIDESQGVLSLSDAEGTVTLRYSEPPVEITASDIEALTNELATLQAEIDAAEQEIAAVTQQTENINVTKLRERIKANEEAIADINETIDKLRGRIKANEEAIADINETIGKLRERIKTLEATAEDHEERISALEAAAP